MKDQPWDLNQAWPVGQKKCWFTNAHTNFGGLSLKFGAQKTSFFGHFFRDFCTWHHIYPEWNVASTNKNATMCHLEVDLLSVTFDTETAEICFVIVTHPLAAITLEPS